MACSSSWNQYWQIEDNTPRTCSRRLSLFVSITSRFCRLHHVECELTEHARPKGPAGTRGVVASSKIPVIASGGIFDAKSAREKFEAGAQLVQLYTGFVYRGPHLLREIMAKS